MMASKRLWSQIKSQRKQKIIKIVYSYKIDKIGIKGKKEFYAIRNFTLLVYWSKPLEPLSYHSLWTQVENETEKNQFVR